MLYGGNVHILNLGCKLAVFTASKVVFSTFFFSVNLVFLRQVLCCQLSGLHWNSRFRIFRHYQPRSPRVEFRHLCREEGISATFVINVLSIQMMPPAD